MTWSAVSALAAAATAVLTALCFAWRRVVRPLIKGGLDFLEDWNGERERPGVPGRAGVMERLSRIEEQLHPNNGSSLRDAVTRIERKLTKLGDPS